MKKHSRSQSTFIHRPTRFVSFLVVILLLFGAVSVLNFSVFAENEDASFDSFALHEEYQALAESFDLNTRLQERENFDSEYEPLYENIFVRYCAKESFDQKLDEETVVFHESDFDDSIVFVPMIDTASGQFVAYAEIGFPCHGDNYTVIWHDSETEIITEETLNDQFGITSSYVLIEFDYGLNGDYFIYAYETELFYDSTRLSAGRNNGKSYTAEELLEYNEDARWENTKRVFGPIFLGLLKLMGIVIVFPLVLTGALILLIQLLRRKKKKALQEKTLSSDV